MLRIFSYAAVKTRAEGEREVVGVCWFFLQQTRRHRDVVPHVDTSSSFVDRARIWRANHEKKRQTRTRAREIHRVSVGMFWSLTH